MCTLCVSVWSLRCFSGSLFLSLSLPNTISSAVCLSGPSGAVLSGRGAVEVDLSVTSGQPPP